MTYPDLPPGPYRTIVADPPWRYDDHLPGPGRGAEKHYATLTVDEICALPVGALAATDAHLYLWVPNAFLEDAYRVARAWGFNPKQTLTWVKVRKDGTDLRIGMGRMLRNATEHALVCTRGRLAPQVRNAPNVVFAERREHSEKPAEAYDLIRQVSPASRIDLFARQAHEGFDGWGWEYAG